MAFKLAVVREYEQGGYSLTALSNKYGIQGKQTLRYWVERYRSYDKTEDGRGNANDTKDAKILELEQQVRLLERKNARLERELEIHDYKVNFFDMMIDIAVKDNNKFCFHKNAYNEQTVTL